MLGFTRLSDLFNNAPGEFIGAFTHITASAGEGVVRRDLVVRLRDVLLVRPIDEQPAPISLARSCRTTAERAAGTSIVTVEGVSFHQFPMTAVHPHAQHAADREEQ